MLKKVAYVDLFCGIGGFRFAMQAAAAKTNVRADCVFSCDIDAECRKAYFENFGDHPHGDITDVDAVDIPDHDVLLAGFPCQPFSIIGHMKGFNDARGTLFFDIARILEAKKPAAFVLENVKLLARHNQGHTLKQILDTLYQLGYHCSWKVLNALDFGLPQKRERVFIVGARNPKTHHFVWPAGDHPMAPLKSILEKNVPEKFFASAQIKASRKKKINGARVPDGPSIWHENKGGNISAHPFSCALRAGASYNYLLVNGERRLTPREMLRLQGFPDEFEIVCNDSQTRKQAGNTLPVPVARQVIECVLHSTGYSVRARKKVAARPVQTRLLENAGIYNVQTA